MRISVWSHNANPKVDPRLFGKSRVYCETEVAEGRAFLLDPSNILAGIQLLPPHEARNRTAEHRGSPEARGCLTPYESQLNAEYHRQLRSDDLTLQITELAGEYEYRLEKHEREGRRGSPRACSVIAAKVKTLLSDPALSRKVVTV